MMHIEHRRWKAPEAAAAPNNSWFLAVEQGAMEERLDELLGDTFWEFIEDPHVTYVRETGEFVITYLVPLVLPIRGLS